MESWISSNIVPLLSLAAMGGYLWFSRGRDNDERENLRKEIHEGFSGVHSRLDILNGKVFKHEGEIQGLKGRMG